MAKATIQLLERWQTEAPDLVAVDWLEVHGGITASICRKYDVGPNQIFSRCTKTPSEFADEIIEEYLLGGIVWSHEQAPTTASMIALLRRAASRDVLDQCFCREDGKRVVRKQLSLDEPGAMAAHTRQAQEPVNYGYIDQLRAELQKRPDPHPLFLDYLELQMEALKPAAIAEELKIPIAEVHKMRKRLKRRLAPLVAPSMQAGRPREARAPARNQVHHV